MLYETVTSIQFVPKPWGPSCSCLQNITLISLSLSSEYLLNCNVFMCFSENSLVISCIWKHFLIPNVNMSDLNSWFSSVRGFGWRNITSNS